LSTECEVIGTRIRVLAQIAYLTALPRTLDRFGAAFTPETRRLAEDLGPRVADFMQELLSGPGSFVHADYHLNNLFFDPDSGEVAIVDWQTSGPNNPLLDVALFLSRSVTPEARRGTERAQVEAYWEALRHAGVAGFSLEECWRHYRMGMLFSLLIMVLGAGNLGSGNRLDRGDFEDILRRVTTAAGELDAAEFVPGRRRLASPAWAFSALSGLGYGFYTAVRHQGTG
ncbi:MAG: phosphotransferase, partial [Rhodobacteraceae bacterium]|nr:phosphotransferase [Paracoccaceae bacterium]